MTSLVPLRQFVNILWVNAELNKTFAWQRLTIILTPILCFSNRVIFFTTFDIYIKLLFICKLKPQKYVKVQICIIYQFKLWLHRYYRNDHARFMYLMVSDTVIGTKQNSSQFILGKHVVRTERYRDQSIKRPHKSLMNSTYTPVARQIHR